MNQLPNDIGINDSYAAMFTNDTGVPSSSSSSRVEDQSLLQSTSSPIPITPINQLTLSGLPHQGQQTGPAIEVPTVPTMSRTGVANGDEDEEDGEDEEDPNLTSSGRRSRSHVWPPLSDSTPTIPRPIVFQTKVIGHTGQNAGRNLMAVFAGSDGEPRTRYNLRVLRGRTLSSYLAKVRHYPLCDTPIPGGLTLAEICRSYPRHVWGTGLRLFIAEGWTGEQIYNAFPPEFQESRAAQRKWNYIQQGFTREVKRINDEEAAAAVNVSVTRKRKAREARLGQRSLSLPPALRPAPVPQPPSSVHMNFVPGSAMDLAPTYHQHFDRQAELDQQDMLLLAIMSLTSVYSVGPLNERMNRTRCARIFLLRMSGVEVDTASEAQLKGLTTYLERELTRVRRQHQG